MVCMKCGEPSCEEAENLCHVHYLFKQAQEIMNAKKYANTEDKDDNQCFDEYDGIMGSLNDWRTRNKRY